MPKATAARLRAVVRRLIPVSLHAPVNQLYRLAMLVRYMGNRERAKREGELGYWRSSLTLTPEQQRNRSDHYRHVYTTQAGLSEADYAGKRVLDIGCGPRGSLEWAHQAADRVGLDPLADSYGEFGIDQHAMRYVNAPAERMPLPDASFDIVTALNALDHVDDIDATLREVARVIRPGGTFLVMVEVNHSPTLTEPGSFGFELVDRITAQGFTVEYERRYERPIRWMYDSIDRGLPYDEQAPRHHGILVARFRREAH